MIHFSDRHWDAFVATYEASELSVENLEQAYRAATDMDSLTPPSVIKLSTNTLVDVVELIRHSTSTTFHRACLACDTEQPDGWIDYYLPNSKLPIVRLITGEQNDRPREGAAQTPSPMSASKWRLNIHRCLGFLRRKSPSGL